MSTSSSSEPCQLTIGEAHELLKHKKLSSVELTKAVLDRISKVEERTRAFVTTTADLALSQAEEADKRFRSGETTPLTG